ncbi:hypothetical protein [Cohnella sp. 56]
MESNIIYENDWITCILDISPLNEGHMLILLAKLLKSHFQRRHDSKF